VNGGLSFIISAISAIASTFLTFLLSKNYFDFLRESKTPKTEALIAYEDKLVEEARLQLSR
jgi:uncharacterized membrane protein YdjX (TVP38/TMEM64 family)